MCGIWGVVNIADEQIGETAAQAMQHRGPDDHGVYVSTEPMPVTLVNVRLSIIDLSESGHQPISTPDGRYWIVYNGEVYNYQALRQILIETGHQFKSTSDTEVVLHAYQEWGEQCLDNLRGMFAFAIWDNKTSTLFAARDRLGIKPFYYTQKGMPGEADAQFVFGSELKAILASGLVEPHINYEALHHFLSFYSVPTPYTILQDIEALPPGHSLIYKDGVVRTKRYWALPPYEPLNMSADEIVVKLRALLEESIRFRMIADVPVGAFLSGGIDSSAVVALMTRATGERLRTFSIGFGEEGEAIDERSAARVLAEHYGTEHTEVIVGGAQVREQIGDIIRAMDQPSGDGLNTFLVSQATAQHVKVALSGLGGDELFAGYPQFNLFRRADRARNLWAKLPGVARRATRETADLVDPLQRAVTWLDGDMLARYERVRILFNEEDKLKLYTQHTLGWLAAPEPSLQYLGRYLHPAETDSIAKLTRLELMNYMTHTLLRDTDAMSMAHSLEVRVPLIDHKLVEFGARIPAELKLQKGRGKWIFAKALEDVLPESVLNRPKRGFEMPVASWMQHDLRDVLEDVFSKESVGQRGLFEYEAAAKVYRDFREGRGPYMRAWALAVLELWLRQFVDGKDL
jgi:asparagine synthase (glutamine-hydrolysing)